MDGRGRRSTDGGRARVRAIPVVGRPPWLLPLLLVAAGVAVTLVIPGRTFVGAPFSAAPLVAAALWTFRGTSATAAVSVLLSALLLLGWCRMPFEEVALRLAAVSTVSVLAVVISRVLGQSDVSLASVRRIAETAQLAALPVPPGRIGDLALAVRYEAAHEGALIGGDLYGVQQTPYGVRLLVGDVRGKGLNAVGTVIIVLGAFREAAETEADLAAVAQRIEHALIRETEQRNLATRRAEGFVTAVLAEIPAGEPGSLRIVNRGHPPPLLIAAGGSSVRALEPESYALPLGLGELADGTGGRTGPLPFPPGSLLLLHTDGVTEARNAEGDFYDPVVRLRGRRLPGPGALLDALLADVAAYTGGRTDDDMALLAVARDAVPPAHGRARSDDRE